MTKDKTEPGSDGSQLPGPGVGFTFLYYFSMTIVVVVIAGSQGLNLSVASVQLYRYGIILGVLAGGIGSYFNRTASIDISTQDASVQKSQLGQILADLGFERDSEATEQQEDYTVYRRSGLASLFSGKIFIAQRSSKTTQVVSRAATLRQLQRRL
ncbi:MAG: hypothetical protein AAF329_28785 [Cyanobacteria bacterium P01_A01_bin.17]